jgi:hypothetical protein
MMHHEIGFAYLLLLLLDGKELAARRPATLISPKFSGESKTHIVKTGQVAPPSALRALPFRRVAPRPKS